ncbi:hypothetical protein C2E23DRAFT_845040 [Lenzites betulinus]|nr:hypothetical protein C2E23DRAFT_845040 [Lenzites betulinus]
MVRGEFGKGMGLKVILNSDERRGAQAQHAMADWEWGSLGEGDGPWLAARRGFRNAGHAGLGI